MANIVSGTVIMFRDEKGCVKQSVVLTVLDKYAGILTSSGEIVLKSQVLTIVGELRSFPTNPKSLALAEKYGARIQRPAEISDHELVAWVHPSTGIVRIIPISIKDEDRVTIFPPDGTPIDLKANVVLWTGRLTEYVPLNDQGLSYIRQLYADV